MSGPQPGQAPAGELAPNYYYHRLPNGLELVGQRMPSLSSITLGVQVSGGVRDEPQPLDGLTYLLSEMMFQGTRHRSVRQLTEDFEAIGGHRGGEPSLDFVRYFAQVVNNRFERAIELLADVMLFPTFPADEFAQMRAIQLQEIRRRDDEPMRRILDLVRERFYHGTALGRRVLGTRESVERLRPDDLRVFWQAHSHPRGALLSVAGSFDWHDVVERVAALLGGWSGDGPATPEDHPQPADAVVIERIEGNQEHIAMGYPFPTYGDPDYFAASLVNEILGGGMTSRLFREVREKRGLVYTVSAIFAPNNVLGAQYLYAGTTPAKAHETMRVMIAELTRLRDEGVTADELERAKVQLKSEQVMRGESSAARMSALARSWWYERRLLTIAQLKEAIDAVTTEQIQRLLSRFPPMRPLVIAAIGPRSEEELIGDSLARR